ncbi:MAG: CHAT domain-containing protein [Pyrinomonadaceae bacterium]
MPLNPNDEVTLRQYLLGQVTEAQRQVLEERLLSEDNFLQELEVIEDDLVDHYVAGDLAVEDRQKFEEYFLAIPERVQKIKFARALKKYVSSAAGQEQSKGLETSPFSSRSRFFNIWRQPLPASSWAIAAAAVVVLGLGFAIWRGFFVQSDVEKGLVALNAAYREQRPIEARISNFDYAPYSVTRGNGTERGTESELRLAELTLLDALKNKSTPAVHHALGKVYLANRNFDRAIEQFEEALKSDPNNAQLASDLGAAHLEKAKIDFPRGRANPTSPELGKGMEELARSLEALNKALELNPNLLEALFNRALVYQEMLLPRQAQEDWKKYLEKDGNSKWADEARRHLMILEENKPKTSRTKVELLQDFLAAYEAKDDERAWEIIRRSRDAFSAGKLIRDQLLDQYLRTSVNGKSHDAESALEALAFVGKLELRTGDVYTSELTRFYRFSSPTQREILTRARELVKMGQQSFARASPLEAIEIFNEAKRLFERSGNHWETQYADLWIGYCYLNSSNTKRSITVLQRLASSFERQDYKWLHMRALHLLSGAEYNFSEYSRAINHNQLSLALAEEMGDAIGAFNALSILIEQYRYIGNYGSSLACIQRSLSILDSCALNEIQIAQHYGIIASSLSSSGFHSAAAVYQTEALRQALTTSQVQTISRAYANLGTIYGKISNFSEALKNAKLAYDTAKSHSDESIKRRMMAYTSLQIGDLYKQAGETTKAIESYDECLELCESLDDYYGLYEAHKNRLFCYILLKNDSAAKEELQTTLSLVEKYRAQIREGDNRNHFFDIEQSVYDLAIDFEYSRMKNPEKAFEYSEASRSRSLLDLVNSNANVSSVSSDISHPDIVFDSLAQPLTLRDIQKRIPHQAQVIQYTVLSDKVLIWVITKTDFSTLESKVGQEDLVKKVFHYLQELARGSTSQTPQMPTEAKQLFDILIKPVEPLLQKSSSIYVVPDKVLNYLPFAALISPATNKFLVEDYLTVISPSSSLLVHSSEIGLKKKGKTVERILSVGNPSFDRSEFPELAELPAAAREAEEVAKYYDSSCLLTGPMARKSRIQMEMEKSQVIHFAVHSVFNQRTPLRSKLLLTKEVPAAGDGLSGSELEARDIHRMKLSNAKLVVLSACQSGVEQYYGGEGMISLARPFLAANVPVVVASLWAVDSDSTAELMISFHKFRRRYHLSSAEALRRAQLDMLSSPDERLRQPYCWASFITVGGGTSF